ncbi:MAG TPA: hypothetical protein VK085_00560 [Pseudogracilibacillus sp.]|nr:hypothetical protein [Pseudogracilibacillus sp.]
MIVPILGNVTYSITLDPSVWIFDDRKVELDKAFDQSKAAIEEEIEISRKAAERWNKALHPQHSKPPVNPNISRAEGKEILKRTYVIPVRDFIESAEPGQNATEAALVINGSEDFILPLTDLREGFLLFSREGKPLKEDGPVHFYYSDPTKSDQPIKNVLKIKIL